MDVRLSSEQRALRESVAQVVDRLSPTSVRELDDTERAAKLDAAVAASGWRELRAPADDGVPWSSAVEASIVAEELARGVADTSYLGPALAADLRRLARAPTAAAETVAFASDLAAPAVARRETLSASAVAFDGADCTSAIVLVPGPDGHRLGQVALDAAAVRGADLTRRVLALGPAAVVTPVPDHQPIPPDALVRWQALGLALTCADLVGTMRGAIRLAVDYAGARRQYGVPIASFQAVQHLLADALVSMEGSRSVGLHAAWAVDALSPGEALAAGAVAKAYCARAARAVCETVIQVHGGIGNTWECLAHVYLRRALVSIDLFGGVGPNLARVLDHHQIGAGDGLR